MAFSSYKTIGEVLKAFQTTYTESNFMGEAEFNIPDYFREDLETDAFTRNIKYYFIQDLDKLFSVVNYVFQQSELQLNNLVTA